MNDDEMRSPDDVEFEEVDMGKSPDKPGALASDDEFSSVALSEARNANNYGYEADEGLNQISEETPSESTPLDSQCSETSQSEQDLQLISEQVREGGLPISDETIKMAKQLLPDGDQVAQSLEQLDTTIKLEMLLN